MASERPAKKFAAAASNSHVNGPFGEFISTDVEPCALDEAGKSLPFHLLACGHVVAVDCHDTRCGLNCLHVATWMTQKLSQQDSDSIDLAPGKSLFEAVTFSAARPHHPVHPPQSPTQGHDKLFCEMCYGIPIASYNLAKPEHGYRRALSLTRPVIEHFTSYVGEVLDYFLAKLYFNPHQLSFDVRYTHFLRCGHEVWCTPVRPCAANCSDMPPCRGRVYPRNVKQGDAILCKECTFRVELVYARYAQVGRGGAQEEVAQNGLSEGANRNAHGSSASQVQNAHLSHHQGSREEEDQPGLDGQSSLGNVPLGRVSAVGHTFVGSSNAKSLNANGAGGSSESSLGMLSTG
jgi:hypothetical protein